MSKKHDLLVIHTSRSGVSADAASPDGKDADPTAVVALLVPMVLHCLGVLSVGDVVKQTVVAARGLWW
jgi:hypothetical protein